jgi:hypothetical protein
VKLFEAQLRLTIRQLAAQCAFKFQLFGWPTVITDAFPAFANFEWARTLFHWLSGKRFKLA